MVLGVPRAALGCYRKWERLWVPTEGAVALMRPQVGPLHVGIYTAGGMLHLGAKVSLFQPMSIIERDFRDIRFYDRRNCNN